MTKNSSYMGSVLSKLTRNNQIFIFPRVRSISNEEYYADDSLDEEGGWMSDQIVTIQSEVGQLDLNNNSM